MHEYHVDNHATKKETRTSNFIARDVSVSLSMVAIEDASFKGDNILFMC